MENFVENGENSDGSDDDENDLLETEYKLSAATEDGDMLQYYLDCNRLKIE